METLADVADWYVRAPLTVVLYCACASVIIWMAMVIVRQIVALATMPVIMRQTRDILAKLDATHTCCHGDFAKLTTILESHTSTLGAIHYQVTHDAVAKEEPLDLQKPCAVCKGAEVTHIVWPCAHLCLCGECAAQSQHFHNQCPVCNTPYRGINRVYT